MKNNIIIKTETLRHFFYLDGKGICTRQINEKSFEILIEDGFYDFDAVLDNKGIIHLIAQNLNGSILYLSCIDGKWRKTVLFKSKTKEAVPKFFKLLVINGHINLFYVIHYNNHSMLIHQLLDNYDAIPSVIDYVSSSVCPYSAQTDENNNIHCIYTNEEHKIMHKMYQWSKKEWNSLPSPETSGERVYSPFCYVLKNKIYLVYVSKAERFYNIFYNLYEDGWKEEKNVFFDCSCTAMPTLSYYNGLYLSWIFEKNPIIFKWEGDAIKRQTALEFKAKRENKKDYIKLTDGKRSITTLGYIDKDNISLLWNEEFLNIDKKQSDVGFKEKEKENEEFQLFKKELWQIKKQLEQLKSEVKTLKDTKIF